MKSSLFLVTTGALLASAGPLVGRDVKYVEVNDVQTVTEYTTVTLPPGEAPTTVVQYDDVSGDMPAAVKYEEASIETTPPVIHKHDENWVDRQETVQPTGGWTSYGRKHSWMHATPVQPDRKSYPSAPPVVKPDSRKSVVQPKSGNKTPSPPSTGSYSDTNQVNLDDYSKAVLKAHNDHRRKHGTVDLRWNSTLASIAQDSARKCISFHDSKGKGFGQNLAWYWATNVAEASEIQTGLNGMESWYDEVKYFDDFYDRPSPYYDIETKDGPKRVYPKDQIGHFTQMVWKSTLTIGCATHKCGPKDDNKVTTVCNYFPPGNFAPGYNENVARPQY